jgi:hypothetical protein
MSEDLRALFTQKPLRFLPTQTHRDLAEVHEPTAGGQKPAFTENLDARVLISAARVAHHQ